MSSKSSAFVDILLRQNDRCFIGLDRYMRLNFWLSTRKLGLTIHHLVNVVRVTTESCKCFCCFLIVSHACISQSIHVEIIFCIDWASCIDEISNHIHPVPRGCNMKRCVVELFFSFLRTKNFSTDSTRTSVL